MKRRTFLQFLLGAPAAIAMGADAISALRPVKEPEVLFGRYDSFRFIESEPLPEYFDNLVDLDGNKIEIPEVQEQFYGPGIPEMLHVQKTQTDMNKLYRSMIDGQG